MISFAKKEKSQATLIHPEKEKFPCSAETGEAGRHHRRRRPVGKLEVDFQMPVPSQSSLLDSSALAHLSTGRLRASWPGSSSVAGERVEKLKPVAPSRRGWKKEGAGKPANAP